MLAYSSTEHGHIAHQTRVAQQAKSCCGVKMGNLQGLKADSDVLFDSFLNIKDRTNLKCDMQLKTDMIQEVELRPKSIMCPNKEFSHPISKMADGAGVLYLSISFFQF